MNYFVKLLSPVFIILSPIFSLGQQTKRGPVVLDCNTNIAESLYGGTQADYAAWSAVVPIGDGGYLLLGRTHSFGNGGDDAYVIRLDKNGVVLWSKTYGGTGDDGLSQGKLTSDGGFILGGYTKSYGHPAGDAWLIRIDVAGNLIWSKAYGDGNPYGDILTDLVQTHDGGFAFGGIHKWAAGVDDAMLVRTDANGNMLWAKGFDHSGSTDECDGIAEHNDSLLMTSFYLSGTGYDAVLMKIEEVNGNVSWMRSWDFDGRTNRLNYINPVADGYLINGVNTDDIGVTNGNNLNVKTDFNGNIIFVHELHPVIMNGFSYPTADGGYIIENDESIAVPNSDMDLTKVDKDGNVEWSRRYSQPGQQIQAGVIQTPDGGYAAMASTNQAGNSDLLLIKTDAAGQTSSCTSTSIPAYNRTPVVTEIPITFSSIYDIVFTVNTVVPVVTSPVTVKTVLCQQVEYCLDLHLTGEDTICDMRQPVSYKALRSPGCVTPVQWAVDNTYADVLAQTDSTIQLQFKQTGTVILYGQLSTNCSILQDKLPIQIFQPLPIELGSQTGFCPGGNVVLDAGGGFQSYTWSSGEATQQITVNKPGDYWVSAVNSGGDCLSGDTISIAEYLVPVVNLGPDRSICRDSVFRFDASSSPGSYLWQDGSSNSDFYASDTGNYRVTVTNEDGCSSSDTVVVVSIVENPKDFLETADQICSQGQLPIRVTAIGNWDHYLWSDGSASASAVIDVPGQYWLQVTNKDGCTARDTLTINGIACPLGIFFPSGFSPNSDGNNDVFRPIVYALLDKFYMAIYDRWGERVFETNDPYRGWDGRVAGRPQTSGIFVWYSQYQLRSDHGKVTMKKGTLTLIR